MEFLIKFAQAHESFRLAEIESLALVEQVNLEVVEYDPEVRNTPKHVSIEIKSNKRKSPYCTVKLPSAQDALRLIQRSILAQSVHELLGTGDSLVGLHESVKNQMDERWQPYRNSSFKFAIDSFQGSRTNRKRLEIINSFDYLPLDGKIKMSEPDETFTVFEVWDFESVPTEREHPNRMYLGRFIGSSSRDIVLKFDLKKRSYISTTSMDSELALITANIALAGPGKLFYDPFVGTGSFPIACAHFGAMSWGSDIDGRSIRGDGDGKCLTSNFEQYSLRNHLGDVFAADITNSPIRIGRRLWDGIVCDPPYGVREGLRVLGVRDPEKTPWVIEKGKKHGL